MISKEAAHSAYRIGVKKALHDSGLVKIALNPGAWGGELSRLARESPAISSALGGSVLGGGLGAAGGLATRDEGGPFGIGGESRGAAALRGALPGLLAGGLLGGGLGYGRGMVRDTNEFLGKLMRGGVARPQTGGAAPTNWGSNLYRNKVEMPVETISNSPKNLGGPSPGLTAALSEAPLESLDPAIGSQFNSTLADQIKQLIAQGA